MGQSSKSGVASSATVESTSNDAQQDSPSRTSSKSRSASPHSDPMDVSSDQTPTMAPPTTNGTETSQNGVSTSGDNTSGGASAAAAVNQPKVVQTAFIHKLYNMLEDQNIQHLISWSNSNESFLISPTSEFSKVLASYFKHTNISSFVRQLNMYGFHKVSDVFHTGSSDTPLWEFKHGNGNFKRGDLHSLKEIKRRASRHSLVHRDSFPTTTHRMSVAAPPPIPPPPEAVPGDPTENRLNMLESSFFEVHGRLARTEEAYTFMANRCHALTENLINAYQYNHDISKLLTTLVPDADHQVHREAAAMQKSLMRQISSLQTLDNPPQGAGMYANNHRSYLSAANDPSNAPLSPRQVPQEYSLDRRNSTQHMTAPPRQGLFRPLAPSPNRYGSIGPPPAATASPSSFRNMNMPPAAHAHPPPPPLHLQQSHHPPPAPPANPFMRRHTSADIRTTPGWHPGLEVPQISGSGAHTAQASSPYASGNNSAQWPSSPRQMAGDAQLRNSLAQYRFGGSSAGNATANTNEPPRSPPNTNANTTATANATFGAAGGARRGSSQVPPSRPLSPHGPSAPQQQQTEADQQGAADSGGASGWNTLPSTRLGFKDPLSRPLAGVFAGGSAGDGGPGGSGSAPPTRRSSMQSNVHSLLNPTMAASRGDGRGDDREGEKEGEREMPEERKRKRERVA